MNEPTITIAMNTRAACDFILNSSAIVNARLYDMSAVITQMITNTRARRGTYGCPVNMYSVKEYTLQTTIWNETKLVSLLLNVWERKTYEERNIDPQFCRIKCQWRALIRVFSNKFGHFIWNCNNGIGNINEYFFIVTTTSSTAFMPPLKTYMLELWAASP